MEKFSDPTPLHAHLLPFRLTSLPGLIFKMLRLTPEYKNLRKGQLHPQPPILRLTCHTYLNGIALGLQ